MLVENLLTFLFFLHIPDDFGARKVLMANANGRWIVK